MVRYCEPEQLFNNPLSERGGNILYSSSESLSEGQQHGQHGRGGSNPGTPTRRGHLLDRTNSNAGPLAEEEEEEEENALEVFQTPMAGGKENATCEGTVASWLWLLIMMMMTASARDAWFRGMVPPR